MAELDKKILNMPSLPNVVQGDGRHLMSLLKDFLAQTAEQVNLANGFSAEEIHPEEGKYPTPRNFFLSFSRLGGELSWSHLSDVTRLAYYELRTNTNVGTQLGLLERTRERTSTTLPPSSVGTIYLYAIDVDGYSSNPSKLDYSKARPEMPRDISMTRNNEGVLITFLEIPTNCIGANIYIDGVKYSSLDNLYLYQGDSEKIEQIKVAYYDQFGEGELSVLHIVLPDVTGFLVERNGSQLDFYWDPVNIYGVEYVVKVNNLPNWESALELFRSKTNAKNRYIYPNAGSYYLLIKAVDVHGNYSRNASYMHMTTAPEINRNIILEFDQRDIAYGGSKINLFYDPLIEGVTLERESTAGEYIVSIDLPQKYRARNWIELSALAVTNSNITWEDVGSWEETELVWAGDTGDTTSVNVTQEIAYINNNDLYGIMNARFNNSLTTAQGDTPSEKQHADTYLDGRWAKGVQIVPNSRLSYDVQRNGASEIHFVFCLKYSEPMTDSTIVVLKAGNGRRLILNYIAGKDIFVLTDDIDEYMIVQNPHRGDRDWLTIGISQSSTTRSLYLHSLNKQTCVSESRQLPPVGIIKKIFFYNEGGL